MNPCKAVMNWPTPSDLLSVADVDDLNAGVDAELGVEVVTSFLLGLDIDVAVEDGPIRELESDVHHCLAP